MREKTIKAAMHFDILDKVQEVEKAVLNVEGVVFDKSSDGVDIDIDNYYDCRYIILVPKYDYHKGYAHEVANRVLEAIKPLGLKRTQDCIEDYGEHIYIVTEY